MSEKNIIAVCCATIRELSVLEPLNAICDTANHYGLKVQIYQSFEELDEDKELNSGEKTVFNLIDYKHLCGIIIFGERIKDPEIVRSLIQGAHDYNLPVVSFDQKQEDCFNVIFDYADAFEQIVRHLVEYHKLKKLFVMAGIENNPFSDERLEVVRRVLAEHGLTLQEDDIAYGQFWEIPTKEAMQRFFESGKELPEAFISFNDTMATVIIDEIQSRGYRVPEDVIVTGFDGIDRAEVFVPTITTAKQQFEMAGRSAVELIRDYNTGECKDLKELRVPFKMLIRQSCGCMNVDIARVTGNLRYLHDDTNACKRFALYMDEMTRRMLANGNMEGLLNHLIGYSHFVDNHDYICFCVPKEFLKYDRDFFEKACKINPDLMANDAEDMVLLAQIENGIGQDTGFKTFAGEDLLPDMEKWKQVMENQLIVSIHVGERVFGHMVLGYKIGNKNPYKTKLFVNKVASALLMLEQKGMIFNSNRELLEAKNRLEMMYILDPMTEIYNRRGFYARMPEYLKERKGGYISVISVDLDYLKYINDHYGHQEGDFAILTLSRALAEMVGKDGIYARFGGDEFVAMTYQETYTADISERMWKDMMQRLEAKSKEANKPYRIQCSLGLATEPLRDDINIEAMISQSDKMLYQMKNLHHEKAMV